MDNWDAQCGELGTPYGYGLRTSSSTIDPRVASTSSLNRSKLASLDRTINCRLLAAVACVVLVADRPVRSRVPSQLMYSSTRCAAPTLCRGSDSVIRSVRAKRRPAFLTSGQHLNELAVEVIAPATGRSGAVINACQRAADRQCPVDSHCRQPRRNYPTVNVTPTSRSRPHQTDTPDPCHYQRSRDR